MTSTAAALGGLPSPLFLIRENLSDTSPHCRHLMLLTESSSAARLLFDCDLVARHRATVLVGSQFSRDANSELRMVRQINEVKRAMQSGGTVILVNHEGIFPSLYDVLNMRYTIKRSTETGRTTRMLRLAVGNRSQWCSVGDGFKIIVVVESKDAYERLDLPLLNRFEKQMLRASDALREDAGAQQRLAMLQAHVADVERLAQMQSAFVGMYEQTLASLVLSSEASASDVELKNKLNALMSPLARVRCSGASQHVGHLLLPLSGKDLFTHASECQADGNQLLVLTHSTAHDFDLLMRQQNGDNGSQASVCTALSGVTSELEFIQALKQNPGAIKYVQCDPLSTPQSTIEHARYLALQQQQHGSGALTTVFIIHLPPAAGKRRRTYQVDFQKHWRTVFLDDLLQREEEMLGLIQTSPLAWAKQNGNARRVCRAKLPQALARAKPPIMANLGISQRIAHVAVLLDDADSLFWDEILWPALHNVLLALDKSGDAHVRLVASGEARAGTFTCSLVLALEQIIINAFAITLRWMDTNCNLQTYAAEEEEQRELWRLLCVSPPIEFISIQSNDSSAAAAGANMVRNLGLPGFPCLAAFPWSFRVYEALESIATTKADGNLRVLEGAMESIFGQRATVLGNKRCMEYLHDLCSFSANRRVELAVEEQVHVVANWLDFATPQWRSSLASTHLSYIQEAWAIFSLLSIRIALLDLDCFSIAASWYVERGNVVQAFSPVLVRALESIDEKMVEDEDDAIAAVNRRATAIAQWLAVVNKIRPHVHAKFLLHSAYSQNEYARLLLSAAHVQVFRTTLPSSFQPEGGKEAGLLPYLGCLDVQGTAEYKQLVASYVECIALDLVSQTWFQDDAVMHALLDYICKLDEQQQALGAGTKPIRLTVVLAICRHDELAPELVLRLEEDPRLFSLALDLAEDLFQNEQAAAGEFFPPPKVREICQLRKQIRALGTRATQCPQALEAELSSNVHARAFLLNELIAMHGEFGATEHIHQSMHCLLPVFQQAGGGSTRASFQRQATSASSETWRLNSGILLFGEHLYREAQDLVQTYGCTPGQSLFKNLATMTTTMKRQVVYDLIQQVFSRVKSAAPARTILWGVALTKLDKPVTFQRFALALIYASCTRSLSPAGDFFPNQLYSFLENVIAHAPETNGNAAARTQLQQSRVLLNLAKLSCNPVTEKCWTDLDIKSSKMVILLAAIAVLLSEDEEDEGEDSSFLGNMLRGTCASKADVDQIYIPAMVADELEEIRTALGFVAFWACPEGHRYAIGECTMPMELGKCPECGAAIGGRNHDAVRGVRRLDELNEAEACKPGYLPPDPASLTANAASLRQVLLPGATALYQVCLHALLLLCPQLDVLQRTNASRTRQNLRACLEMKFSAYLTRLEALAFAANSGGADSELFLLGALALCSRSSFAVVLSASQSGLRRVTNRAEAEQALRQVWAASLGGNDRVMQNIDQIKSLLGSASVKREISNLVGGDVLLMAEAMQTGPGQSTDFKRLAWAFRSNVGMSNLKQALDAAEEEEAMTYEFLQEFCRVEHNLELVSYLADVLEWSATLADALALRRTRLTREEAMVFTNEQAVELLPSEAARRAAMQVLHRFCQAFNKAFKLVPFLYECERNPFLTERSQLVDLSGNRSEDARMEMSPRTPVAFSLVAIVQGDADAPSLCLFQLLRALQQLNNTVLDQLHQFSHEPRLVMRRTMRHHVAMPAPPAVPVYSMHQVPTTTMNMPRAVMLSRLVDYNRERDLLPILACNTSSSEGAGRSFPPREVRLRQVSRALAKTLLAGGKAPIRVAIPQFQYANEARRTGSLAALKNRIPQTSELPGAIRLALVQTLDSDAKLQPIIELVDSAITFLSSSAPFDAKMRLNEFARNVLLMDEEQTSWLEQIQLEHLASLYALLEECKTGTGLEDVVHEKYKSTAALPPGEGENELRALASKLDLNLLLPILHDLLLNRLHQDVFPADAPIAEYLEYCTDVDLGSLDWFAQHFPPRLPLRFAFKLWQIWTE